VHCIQPSEFRSCVFELLGANCGYEKENHIHPNSFLIYRADQSYAKWVIFLCRKGRILIFLFNRVFPRFLEEKFDTQEWSKFPVFVYSPACGLVYTCAWRERFLINPVLESAHLVYGNVVELFVCSSEVTSIIYGNSLKSNYLF
jgi:hypothetical protein